MSYCTKHDEYFSACDGCMECRCTIELESHSGIDFPAKGNPSPRMNKAGRESFKKYWSTVCSVDYDEMEVAYRAFKYQQDAIDKLEQKLEQRSNCHHCGRRQRK